MHSLFVFPYMPCSVTLSYFIHAVPMRESLGQHSCTGFTFSITILDGQCFSCFLGIIFVMVRQYRYTIQTSNNDWFVYINIKLN